MSKKNKKFNLEIDVISPPSSARNYHLPPLASPTKSLNSNFSQPPSINSSIVNSPNNLIISTNKTVSSPKSFKLEQINVDLLQTGESTILKKIMVRNADLFGIQSPRQKYREVQVITMTKDGDLQSFVDEEKASASNSDLSTNNTEDNSPDSCNSVKYTEKSKSVKLPKISHSNKLLNALKK